MAREEVQVAMSRQRFGPHQFSSKLVEVFLGHGKLPAKHVLLSRDVPCSLRSAVGAVPLVACDIDRWAGVSARCVVKRGVNLTTSAKNGLAWL